MAQFNNPCIVTSDLIFYYDMDNVKKSFIGQPTTNHVSNPDTMTGWTNYWNTQAASTFMTEFGTIGYRFSSQPSWNGIYRILTIPSTGTYTFSAWFRYWGGSVNNNGATVYISGYGGSDTAVGINKTLVGKWQRISHTINCTNTPLYFYFISYGGTSDGASDHSTWEVTMPQIEAGSTATPFVVSSRSNTQAINDLVKRNTVTATSLTYNANGTFSFNGTNNYCTISDTNYPATWEDSFSIDVWIRIPTGATWHDQTTFGSNSGTPIIGRGSYVGSHGIGRNGTDTVFFMVRTSSGLYFADSTGTLRDTWYNFIGVYDTNFVRIYRNGVLISSTAVTKSGTPGTGVWAVGGNLAFGGNNGGYGAGTYSSIKIYRKALTNVEVVQNFNSSRRRYGL